MKTEEILDRLEGPLMFIMKDVTRNLERIQNLELTMTGLLKKLESGVSFGDRQRKIAAEIAALFDGFDGLGGRIREERVRTALQLISTMRAIELEEPLQSWPETSSVDDTTAAWELLERSVQTLKGVGPKTATLLERKRITTVHDFLFYLPLRYEDRRGITTIADAVPGSFVTIAGTVTAVSRKRSRYRHILEVILDDGTGLVQALWFRGTTVRQGRIFQRGSRFFMTGEIRQSSASKTFIHPEYELVGTAEHEHIHIKRIVPRYSETEGLHQKTIRRIMMNLVQEYADRLPNNLPEDICRRNNLISIGEALRQVHFPDASAHIEDCNRFTSPAHRRLIFEEFFFFELAMALRREGYLTEEGQAYDTCGPLLKKFRRLLPFELTGAQKRVIEEILDDMRRPRPMYRLLQGDVGSGKTVVSMMPMVVACENGFQSAIMAPTEILAEQHYQVIEAWAHQLGLKAVLLTGSLKGMQRRVIVDEIEKGSADLIIGTHALIQEGLSFKRLGVVIIDEQHRFGVLQREVMRRKGKRPDLLVMTATPIPRTLAMTVYGDLDLSVIDELPPSKKPVTTMVMFDNRRDRVYGIMSRELALGNQVFIVYPLVSESENLDLRDATTMASRLQQEAFPNRIIGLVHGRMKREEKDRVMDQFRRGMVDILVSTTVIEVGIDIPSASVMVIEHAERFGLSQLHQLRGRVGRGDRPSFCILLARRDATEDARERLRVMERSNNGFEIAEEDLRLRGPGEFLGIRQSGLPDFYIADVVRDSVLLHAARKEAFLYASRARTQEDANYRAVREFISRRWNNRLRRPAIA